MNGSIKIKADKSDIGVLSSLTTTIKTNLVSAINELNNLKLDKDYSTLNALTTPTTGDILPIEHNGVTYKIDYNALATAILEHTLPNDDIISTARGKVERDQSVDITIGSTGTCMIFIQRNSLGGAIYGVNGNVLTPYITMSGVTASLESNNTVLRISNTTLTVTYLLLRLGTY